MTTQSTASRSKFRWLSWNYAVIIVSDRQEAWNTLLNILMGENALKLGMMDWMMPLMDGLEICREVRKRNDKFYTYLILLNGNARKEDIVVGLEAGADDYLMKPFEKNGLNARLQTGRGFLELQIRVHGLSYLLATCLSEIRGPRTPVRHRGKCLFLRFYSGAFHV